MDPWSALAVGGALFVFGIGLRLLPHVSTMTIRQAKSVAFFVDTVTVTWWVATAITWFWDVLHAT